jgi:hypothetical protein
VESLIAKICSRGCYGVCAKLITKEPFIIRPTFHSPLPLAVGIPSPFNSAAVPRRFAMSASYGFAWREVNK